MRLVSLLGIGLAASSGCGDENARGGNDGGGVDAMATHMFSLGATEVRLRKRFGIDAPAVDHVFLDVGLALKNTGEVQPLSVSPLLFSLQTTDALIYSFSGVEDSSRPAACPRNVSLAIGGKLECHVGFEIPASETVSALLYLDPAEPVARNASAPIATVLPALAACSYWQSPTPSSCVNCVIAARTSPSGICNNEFYNAASACVSACLTSDWCSQLGSSCNSFPACTTALDNYQGCIYDKCYNVCPLVE